MYRDSSLLAYVTKTSDGQAYLHVTVILFKLPIAWPDTSSPFSNSTPLVYNNKPAATNRGLPNMPYLIWPVSQPTLVPRHLPVLGSPYQEVALKPPNMGFFHLSNTNNIIITPSSPTKYVRSNVLFINHYSSFHHPEFDLQIQKNTILPTILLEILVSTATMTEAVLDHTLYDSQPPLQISLALLPNEGFNPPLSFYEFLPEQSPEGTREMLIVNLQEELAAQRQLTQERDTQLAQARQDIHNRDMQLSLGTADLRSAHTERDKAKNELVALRAAMAQTREDLRTSQAQYDLVVATASEGRRKAEEMETGLGLRLVSAQVECTRSAVLIGELLQELQTFTVACARDGIAIQQLRLGQAELQARLHVRRFVIPFAPFFFHFHIILYPPHDVIPPRRDHGFLIGSL